MKTDDFIFLNPLKKQIFFLIFISLSYFAKSQIFHQNSENPFHFAIKSSLGYTNGTLNESIYHSADKTKKISLLEWERKIFLYNVEASTLFKNFHLDFGLESSFPKQKSGEMRNPDWQNPYDYSMKTTYSVGTNFAEKNYNASFSFYYDFEIPRGFFVSPKINCQYLYDSFSRKKGAEGWYGHIDEKYGSTDGKYHWWYEEEARKYPYTDQETGKTWNLAGIDYKKHSFYLWTGFSVGFKREKTRADISFLTTPFTYFSAEDRHHTGTGEDNVFHEIQQDSFSSYKFSFDFYYNLSEFISIDFNAEYLSAFDIKGDLYIDWAKLENQPCGASEKSITARIGFTIKIM